MPSVCRNHFLIAYSIQLPLHNFNKNMSQHHQPVHRPQPATTLVSLLQQSRKLIHPQPIDESLTSSTARASQLRKLQTTAKMIDVRDIIELVEDGRNVRNIPKLEAVVNYGEDTVLPEIIDVCNGVGERVGAAGKGSRVRIRRKVRTEPHQPDRDQRFQEKLLRSCSREHSYLKYKLNRKNLLGIKQSPRRRIQPKPFTLPKQLQSLNIHQQHHNSHPNNTLPRLPRAPTPNNPNPNLYPTQPPHLTLSNILQTTKQYMSQASPLPEFQCESKKQQLKLQKLSKNFSDVMQNEFPPVILASVLRHLNQSEEAIIKQMQEDLVEEEKKQIYKKFSRMMENQQLTYKSHLRHMSEYRNQKRRDNL